MNYISRKFRLSFKDVLNGLTNQLKRRGFGMITTIDFKEDFRSALDVGFRNYKIVCAYDPNFAYKAISLESHMGAMISFNIVVQEHENGEVEVTAVNPLEGMDDALDTTVIGELSSEAAGRLRAAIDAIPCNEPETQNESLPFNRTAASQPAFVAG